MLYIKYPSNKGKKRKYRLSVETGGKKEGKW
jgi:hypothetical protein